MCVCVCVRVCVYQYCECVCVCVCVCNYDFVVSLLIVLSFHVQKNRLEAPKAIGESVIVCIWMSLCLCVWGGGWVGGCIIMV